MGKAHDVQRVSFSGTIMQVRVDGNECQIDIAGESERLRNAMQQQREHFEISPAGYGIHGDDPVKLYRELCEVVEDVIHHFEAEGRPLPSPRIRLMQEVA